MIFGTQPASTSITVNDGPKVSVFIDFPLHGVLLSLHHSLRHGSPCRVGPGNFTPSPSQIRT
jgi:hypothetical protein